MDAGDGTSQQRANVARRWDLVLTSESDQEADHEIERAEEAGERVSDHE